MHTPIYPCIHVSTHPLIQPSTIHPSTKMRTKNGVMIMWSFPSLKQFLKPFIEKCLCRIVGLSGTRILFFLPGLHLAAQWKPLPRKPPQKLLPAPIQLPVKSHRELLHQALSSLLSRRLPQPRSLPPWLRRRLTHRALSMSLSSCRNCLKPHNQA